MKNLILFIIILASSMMACELAPVFIPDPDFIPNHNPPPAPLEVPCSTYVHIPDPAYLQGYIEFDNPLSPYWIIYVGSGTESAPYQDTIFAGQESLIPETLSSMILAYLGGQFPTKSYQRPDASRMSVLVKGTANQAVLQQKVWFRADGAKWYMTFANRGLLHGGAIQDIDTLLALADEFVSCRWFNLRDTNLDSLNERKYMKKNLHHDLCKAGENWADFRFNNFPPGDSMINAYKDAGWSQVLSSVSGSPVLSRGSIIGHFKNEFVADTRGFCVDDDEILELLNRGYVVIADLE